MDKEPVEDEDSYKLNHFKVEDSLIIYNYYHIIIVVSLEVLFANLFNFPMIYSLK